MTAREHRSAAALLLLAAFLLLSACSPRPAAHSRSFFVMDTVITVTLYSANAGAAEEALSLAKRHLEELDALWSRHRNDGDVARINASETVCEGTDVRTAALLRKAQDVSLKTGGAFDVTLAPVSDLWSECAEADRLPTEQELAAVLALTGSHRFTLSEQTLTKPHGMMLDLGGIGKGEAVSSLIPLLRSEEITGGIISFGSNVAVFGTKPDGTPFRVGIRDPKSNTSTLGTLPLSDGTVLSVSGDYERFLTIQGGHYHHVLDPSSGYPSRSGLSSAVVLCADGGLADALSTALLVMGKDAAMSLHASGVYEFEAILISSEGEITLTSPLLGFEAN